MVEVKAATKRKEGPKVGGARESAARQGVLVVVESPAKAETIGNCLGEGYTVLASMGHLIDLPKSRLGVDTEGSFEPEYLTVRGKAPILKAIKAEARKSRLVLLASDNDREGEAIAAGIGAAIADREPGLPMERIVFNEITPRAIHEALASPRVLDEGKVKAQKARRVLDRLVGYNLSPILWKKVKHGLSAGRVQSVALKLVCGREAEVESFIPVEGWTLEASFGKGRSAFVADLVEGPVPAEDGKAHPDSEAEALALAESLGKAAFVVAEVREGERLSSPEPPFTTSTLLQSAASVLGFSCRKTMQLAQRLYEGVEIGSARVGLITFPRTGSTHVSPAALEELTSWIVANYPAELAESPNASKGGAVQAGVHEAVRPSSVAIEPESLKDVLSRDESRLYSLVWERFVASRMSPAKFRTFSVDLVPEAFSGPAGRLLFRAASARVVEPGYRRVLKVSARSLEPEGHALPALKRGDRLPAHSCRALATRSEGPARYTEAGIVRALEESGIGRPSTFVPIVSVLLERYYVTKEGRELKPTLLGTIVNDLLAASFPELLDTGFTARMEASLDAIEAGRGDWAAMLRDFYGPFKRRVDEVAVSLESCRGLLDEPTGLSCENCGKPMVKRLGRNGFFLACSGFPACRTTRSIPLAKCPRCGQGDIVERKKASGRGRAFFGCTRFPDCDFVTYHRPPAPSFPEGGTLHGPEAAGKGRE